MTTAHKLCVIPFCLAILIAVPGFFIDFVPGTECQWYLMATVLSVSGLFIPKARIAAFLVLIVLLFAAYAGYQRGIAYHQRHSVQQSNPP